MFRPEIERGLIHKDFERKGGLAVNRNDIRELAPRGSSALAATALKEVILIHEAVSSGIAFDAADGIRAGHERDYSRESEGSQRETAGPRWTET